MDAVVSLVALGVVLGVVLAVVGCVPLLQGQPGVRVRVCGGLTSLAVAVALLGVLVVAVLS